MATRTISTKLALDGEAEYKAKIKNINAELALHKSELEKVTAQYKNSANSLEALSAKQAAVKGQLEALNQKHREQASMLDKAREAQQRFAAKAEELRDRLKELKASSADTAEEEKKLRDELAQAEEKLQKAANSANFYQRELNKTERDQAKLGAELEKTDRYLREAADNADGCARSIDEYGREVKTAGENSEKFGSASVDAVNQLAAALAAAGIARTVKEIADTLMDCVGTFADFEAQMSTVKAISGADDGQMERLAEKAKQMGATTSFTATEAGQALEYMAMAGWKTEDMLGGLEGIMHLAAASGEGLASTSDIVTDALTAFGLKAEDAGRFADVLAAASSNANTNVGMMGETFKYAAPVAGALGYSIEDTALAIGLMANAGIKGSSAGTALRATLTNLAKPSETVLNYMEELGISLTDSSGQTRSLSELMGVLRDRFADLTEVEKAEYAAGIAGKEAMSGLLAIVNASQEDYRKLAAAIDACNGSAKEMSETKLDNYAGQMKLLESAADGLKLAVGERLTPALTNVAEAGTDAFTWATQFVEENEWVVDAVAGVAGALGALSLGVAGLAAAPAVIGALNAALGLLAANPILAVTAAVVGLGVTVASWAGRLNEADQNTREFTKSLERTREAYDGLKAGLEEQRASARSTADALKNLLSVEERSAAQKEAVKRLVDQLNEAVPELGLAYDEAADSINMTTEALDAMLQRVAAQEEYESQVERLSQLYAEQADISARLKDAQEQLAGAERDAAEAGDLMGTVYGPIAEGLTNQDTAAGRLSATIRELTAAQEENAAQIAELEQAYEDSCNKAMESIESQLGLFNELDGTAKTSIDSLIGALKSQVEYMDAYAANIQKAMELGVDEGLIRKLSDGKEESAQILDAIVNGGQEDIAELNEQLARVAEGKKSFSDTIAQMETEFDQKMAEVVQDLNNAVAEMDVQDDAYKIGENNIQGLIQGAASKRAALVGQYTEMAQAAVAAYKKAVDQHSPSGKFEEAARFDIQGLIEGAEAERQRLADAYDDVAQAALDGMARHLPSTVEEPPAQGGLERRLEAMTAATVNAISGMAASGSTEPIIVNLMLPDGTVWASHYLDPLARYADANGTPIMNKQ